MLLNIQFLIRRLEFFLSPFTWMIILLAWALLTKNPAKRRKLLFTNLVMCFIFGNSFIVDEFMRAWEVEVITIDQIEPEVKTAILLGGGVFHDKDNDIIRYGGNADRYLSVLEPYNQGKIERILICGGTANFLEPWASESRMIKRLFVNCGIPEEDILIEDKSLNTYQNALYAKPILDSLAEGRYLLVTSSSHIRRAAGCFEKQGIDFQVYPANKAVGSARRTELEYLVVPQVKNFFRWHSLIHEWVGYVTYKIFGRC